MIVLLNASSFNNEFAVKFAYNESPDSFLAALKNTAIDILENNLYPEKLKTHFKDSCRASYIVPGLFKIEIGDRALIHAILTKLLDGTFSKKRKSEVLIDASTQDSGPSADQFNEENKMKLYKQIVGLWKAEGIEFSPPKSFSISKVSQKAWQVECSECFRKLRVQLIRCTKGISFNPGNFMRHLRKHNIKSLSSSPSSSLNEAANSTASNSNDSRDREYEDTIIEYDPGLQATAVESLSHGMYELYENDPPIVIHSPEKSSSTVSPSAIQGNSDSSNVIIGKKVRLIIKNPNHI